jgi:hypothetical protein
MDLSSFRVGSEAHWSAMYPIFAVSGRGSKDSGSEAGDWRWTKIELLEEGVDGIWTISLWESSVKGVPRGADGRGVTSIYWQVVKLTGLPICRGRCFRTVRLRSGIISALSRADRIFWNRKDCRNGTISAASSTCTNGHRQTG